MICFDCQCESWPFSFLGGHSTALSPYAPTTRQTAGYAVSTDTRPAAGQDSSRRREEPRVRTPYAEPRISVPVYIFFQNIYIWNSKRFHTAMTRIIPLLFGPPDRHRRKGGCRPARQPDIRTALRHRMFRSERQSPHLDCHSTVTRCCTASIRSRSSRLYARPPQPAADAGERPAPPRLLALHRAPGSLFRPVSSPTAS